MEQLERIEYMENILDGAASAVAELRTALERYVGLTDRLEELSEYYGSELWMADFEADEAGLLPEDLKRGVLSEDAVYTLLEENRELLEELSGFAQM